MYKSNVEGIRVQDIRVTAMIGGLSLGFRQGRDLAAQLQRMPVSLFMYDYGKCWRG